MRREQGNFNTEDFQKRWGETPSSQLSGKAIDIAGNDCTPTDLLTMTSVSCVRRGEYVIVGDFSG
jgi:hypothetical protein